MDNENVRTTIMPRRVRASRSRLDTALQEVSPTLSPAGEAYLDLFEKCLTRSIFEESVIGINPAHSRRHWWLSKFVRGWLGKRNLEIVRRIPLAERRRSQGTEWPMNAETMLSFERLANIRQCVVQAVEDGVPGDLLEAGVWRGGGALYMKAILRAMGAEDRTVYAADSFCGLPKPSAGTYPADSSDRHWTFKELSVPVEVVQENFERYGLLDENVRFLVGWFKDTLPVAPVKQLAVLRADGDMYESTTDILTSLYHKVSRGGFIIIDDYGVLNACKKAVEDFRHCHGVTDPIVPIDHSGVYWRKS